MVFLICSVGLVTLNAFTCNVFNMGATCDIMGYYIWPGSSWFVCKIQWIRTTMSVIVSSYSVAVFGCVCCHFWIFLAQKRKKKHCIAPLNHPVYSCKTNRPEAV